MKLSYFAKPLSPFLNKVDMLGQSLLPTCPKPLSLFIITGISIEWSKTKQTNLAL